MATTFGRTPLTLRRGLAALAVLLLVGVAVYVAFHNPSISFAPQRPAAQAITIPVTPDQIASAMQGDHFYADYADEAPTTLQVTSSVAAVRRQSQHVQVQLRTAEAGAVWCDLGTSAAVVAVGTTITVAAPAKQAARLQEPAGVLLTHCQLVTVP